MGKTTSLQGEETGSKGKGVGREAGWKKLTKQAH